MTMRRSGAPSSDYLYVCHSLHAELTKIRYDRVQDLNRIEDATARVRSSRQLTYDDIEKIRDSAIWNADVFGYWPPRAAIASSLESTKWDFWNLPKREDEAIASLFQVFRQIEPVSVILRFVVPEHYGILSPPVEKVLGLGAFRRHPDRYRTYVDNLREIKTDRGFETAADVDMALWVLQVGVLDDLLRTCLPSDQCEALREGFKRDSKLREIRVGNLTRQLFTEMSRLELAEALLATNVELAGQIAGIEFERYVRRLTRAKKKDKLDCLVKTRLRDLILDSCKDSRFGTKLIVSCRKAVGTRNKAVHPGQGPRREEIERLIEATKALGYMGAGQDQLPKPAGINPSDAETDEPSVTTGDFWRLPTVDKLAAEQGIAAPQQLDRMIGAAAEL